jgi:hypothetical protein
MDEEAHMRSATMTRTGAVARVGTPRVVPTAAAWRALSAICRTEGRVVLVHAPAHGGLLCCPTFTLRELPTSPAEKKDLR